jgi:putative tryptophan/tyrosine transport system substrate-binding protein
MRRREFITGLAGAAAVWPVAVRAQQSDVRRIGVLVEENDPEPKARLSAFIQALADLGWTDGRNVRMDLRWGGGDINRILALAQELVGLKPDIIVTSGTQATAAVQRETRTIPIVFGSVGDPVASRIVAQIDRPSGNITGFANYEAPLGGKWLELLSEITPGLKRATIMFNPRSANEFAIARGGPPEGGRAASAPAATACGGTLPGRMPEMVPPKHEGSLGRREPRLRYRETSMRRTTETRGNEPSCS